MNMLRQSNRVFGFWLAKIFVLFILTERLQVAPVSAEGEDAPAAAATPAAPMPTLPEQIMISNGLLKGKMFQSRSGRDYNGFLGIPYSNFTETKRFQTAVPLVMPWEGVRDAMEFGPPCIQYDSIGGSVKGEENCLFLNVFTPMKVLNVTSPMMDNMNFHPDMHSHWMPMQNQNEPMMHVHMQPYWMPVIVFIHGGLGGEFQEGTSSDFGTGKFLLDEDVVLVTLNYRLGPFGFLNTGDGYALGNMGLKDQVLALEWVRQNIMAFGGDPFRITILGEGAGAVSVHYFQMSPIAQGLFHRAISMSGTSLDPSSFTPRPMEMAKKLGELFSCPSTGNMSSSMELVSCLREKDPKELAERSCKEFKRWGKDYRIPFAPSFETARISGPFNMGAFEGEPIPVVFLPSLSYEDHLNSGSFNKVPWLVGANKDEGLIYSLPLINDGKLIEELNSAWNRIAPNLFLYGDKVPMEGLDQLSGEIRKFYFRDAMIGPDTKENLTNLFSDIFYLRGMRKSSRTQASRGQSVFPFLFNIMGPNNALSKFGISDAMAGPTHTDALQFVFDMSNGMENKFEAGSEQEKVSKKMIRQWTSFAKFGTPIEEMSVWEPAMSGMGDNPSLWRQIMPSDMPMAPFSEQFFDRFMFWDYIGSKYGF